MKKLFGVAQLEEARSCASSIKRAAGRSRYSIPSHHALYDRRKRQISFRFRVPPSGMLLV